MLVLLYFMMMLWSLRVNGTGNSLVLKTISLNYGRQVYPCLQELNLGQDVLTDFLYYWKEDHPFTNRQVGCAVICINKKLNLLDKAGRISKPEAEAFVRSAGGDDNLAKYLFYLYQSCQKVVTEKDPCENALESTNCFRKAVQRAKGSPNVQVEVKHRNDG